LDPPFFVAVSSRREAPVYLAQTLYFQEKAVKLTVKEKKLEL
jgi:hypothetical protein